MFTLDPQALFIYSESLLPFTNLSLFPPAPGNNTSSVG